MYTISGMTERKATFKLFKTTPWRKAYGYILTQRGEQENAHDRKDTFIGTLSLDRMSTPLIYQLYTGSHYSTYLKLAITLPYTYIFKDSI